MFVPHCTTLHGVPIGNTTELTGNDVIISYCQIGGHLEYFLLFCIFVRIRIPSLKREFIATLFGICLVSVL